MNESGGGFQQGGCLQSQPVAFNEHPSTRGYLTGLRNKPQKKQTSQLVALVLWQLVRILIELSISDKKRTLPLGAYMVGFGKSGHKYV